MGNIQYTVILDTTNFNTDKTIKDIINKYEFEYYDDFIRHIQSHNGTDLQGKHRQPFELESGFQHNIKLVARDKIKKYILSFVEIKKNSEISSISNTYVDLCTNIPQPPIIKYERNEKCPLNFSLDSNLWEIDQHITFCEICYREYSKYKIWYDETFKEYKEQKETYDTQLMEEKIKKDSKEHDILQKYDKYKNMIDELTNHLSANYIRKTYLIDNDMAKRTITLKEESYKIVTVEEVIEAVYNAKIYSEANDEYQEIVKRNIENGN